MRTVTVLLAVLLASQPAAAETIVTVDLVQVIDGRIDEAIFYYRHNWAAHRGNARAKGYITGYRLLIDRQSGDDVTLMLVTEYGDQIQY